MLRALGATKPAVPTLRMTLRMTTPRRALLPPPRFLGCLHEAAVMLLLPYPYPSP